MSDLASDRTPTGGAGPAKESGALVAIVGRPNVGKSTLFNRLVGGHVSIVEDLPGTTRDRIYGDVEWGGRVFAIVDTGGLESEGETEMASGIRSQIMAALQEADVIVFLVDSRDGLTAADYEVSDLLRRANKPVILAANKAENAQRRLDTADFYSLGMGDPITLSAYHGQGTGDLLDRMVELLPEGDVVEEEADVRIAIVGRPNVGKSSLLNALLGYERVLVSEVPGTTRDSTDTVFEHEGKRVVLIDTAGIRKRGKIDYGVERWSVIRSFRAITRADVVLLVIDASEPLTAQDAHIAGYIQDAAKGIIVVVNKWDLVEKDASTADEYLRRIHRELRFLPYAPALFVSALTRQRVHRIVDECLEIQQERGRRVSTAELNEILRQAMRDHNPPSLGGRTLRLRYLTQAEVRPPTFVAFVNDPRLVHFGFERFLENRLREKFGFKGTAIRVVFRATDEQRDRAAGTDPRSRARPKGIKL